MCRSNSSIKWNHRHNLQTWRWPASGHAYFTGMVAKMYRISNMNILKWFVFSEVCIPYLYCPYEIWGCLLFFKWCMVRLASKLDLLSCPTVFYVCVFSVNPGGVGKEERKSKTKKLVGWDKSCLISKGEVEEGRKTSDAKSTLATSHG